MLFLITPCYKENIDTITKNLESVQEQTISKDCYKHFVIFDGLDRTKEILANYKLSKNQFFLVLKKNHDDYGDYIRKVGTKLALLNKADAVSYLDADNYVDYNHFEEILSCYKSSNKNIVISNRRLIKDKKMISLENNSNFYDTNTITLFNFMIKIGLFWSKYPKQLSLVGDRILSHYIKINYGKEITHTKKITVNYSFSKISSLKQAEFRNWYSNEYHLHRKNFLKTFGYDLKL